MSPDISNTEQEGDSEEILVKRIKSSDNPDKNLQNIIAFPTEQIETKERLALCNRYAKDLWSGIEHMAQTPTGFPIDRLVLEPEKGEVQSKKTSPTNIGLFLASVIAARDLKLVSPEESERYVERVLSSLEKVQTYQGLFFNWYDTEEGKVLERKEDRFVSTVDNAWLAAGLMVLETAAPQFSERTRRLITRMNFPLLYDKKNDLFYGGFDPDSQKPTGWHYDILEGDGRMASYVGISQFETSQKNYDHLGRSTPANNEIPDQTNIRQFLSWGGDMFEALMPTLFVPEQLWSQTWRKNLTDYVIAQMNYGVKNNNGYWGYSPSDNPSGIYTEFGLPGLAMKEGGYGVSSVITPHALFLSLGFSPDQAVDTLRRLETTYKIYKEGLGFSDSVDIKTGETAYSYLSLDQEMSFLSTTNYLTKNIIQDYFSPHLEKRVKHLIQSVDYDVSKAA